MLRAELHLVCAAPVPKSKGRMSEPYTSPKPVNGILRRNEKHAQKPMGAVCWATYPDTASREAAEAYSWGENGDRTVPFSKYFHLDHLICKTALHP